MTGLSDLRQTSFDARPALRSAVTLCLHLGAHKTATTLIQARLAALGGHIGARRFTLALPADLKDSAWARWCRTGHGSGGEAVDVFAADVARWAGLAGGLVLVSSEDFIGDTGQFDGRGLYPDAGERAARLATLIAGHGGIELRPLLYLRRTSGFLASCLAYEIAKGRRIDRRRIERAVQPEAFRWPSLVETLETHFACRLPLRRYESIATLGAHGYTLAFLAAFGLPAPGPWQRFVALGRAAELIPPGMGERLRGLRALVRPNAALSARGVAIAEAIRPLVTDDEWRLHVRPYLARHFDAVRDPGGAIALPARLARRLDALYEADLAAMDDRLRLGHPPLTRPGASA